MTTLALKYFAYKVFANFSRLTAVNMAPGASAVPRDFSTFKMECVEIPGPDGPNIVEYLVK